MGVAGRCESGLRRGSLPRRARREGKQLYGRAKEVLRGWQMFELGWTWIYPPDAPIEASTDGRRARETLWLLVVERRLYRLPRRRVGGDEAVQVCLRASPRARRGVFHCRVAPRKRLRPLRRPRLLLAKASSSVARLPVRPSAAKALRAELEEGEAPGRGSRTGAC